MRIVFMGTPEFAVPCLKALIDDKNEIVGVFTQPDKPKGRGYTLTPPPVKVTALENNIDVFQPKTLKDGTALEILKRLNPEMIVVVAYGKILPKEIIDLTKYGCINIHASLLPEYRGAAPIQWAVLDGKKKTGVTAMYMDVGLDTGDMLMKSETEIGENETADELHDRLSVLGSELIVKVVHSAVDGTLIREKQDDSKSCYAKMLTKEMSKIDFTKSAQEVHNQVRGLNSWPSASALLNGKRIKIHRTLIAHGKGEPGQVLSLNPLVVACGEGAVEITELQPEGKKRMSAQSFINGLHNIKAEELRFE
ncbi:MAG: methionyl-tRNA formyltransferase [Clostridia bacterium]|nr:methionyl-tRNA formyltransferase [Clostridia bacterium]